MNQKPDTPRQAKIDYSPKPKSLPLYRVLLHNDEVNATAHVVAVLRQVFGFTAYMAEEVTLKAHTTGLALCAVEPIEHAEFHCEQMISAGLTSTIEPE